MPILEKFDPLSLSTLYLHLKFSETDVTMATATGFMYESEDIYWLITNGHNLTRINPFDNQRIADHCGFPDEIATSFHVVKYNKYMQRSAFTIKLYKDGDHRIPQWFIHPIHGYKVDVVAIPVFAKDELPAHIKIYPINKSFDFDDRFPPVISSDVFVLGYPLDICDSLHMPIWKRATIASEPNYDINNLPYLLVDTATRSGMSGSPVIYQRDNFHMPEGKLSDSSFWGIVRSFLGVYSGRIGAPHNYESQLGIVWKSHIIDEIIKGKVVSGISFQTM